MLMLKPSQNTMTEELICPSQGRDLLLLFGCIHRASSCLFIYVCFYSRKLLFIMNKSKCRGSIAIQEVKSK